MTVVEIDNDIKDYTITLSLEHRLKLPDDLGAATALTRRAILFRNDQGFRTIRNRSAVGETEELISSEHMSDKTTVHG